jgi:hypothetical protein
MGRAAKSDRERDICIQMANTWFEAAIRASRKDRAGISTSLPIEPADIRGGDPTDHRTGQITWTRSLRSFFSPSDSHVICAVVWLLHGRGRA